MGEEEGIGGMDVRRKFWNDVRRELWNEKYGIVSIL
jgi:hypothetical protein